MGQNCIRPSRRKFFSLIPDYLFCGLTLLAGVAAAAAEGVSEAALAARSGPRGATLFAPVTAEQSGVVVVNNYADPKMWGVNYQEFALGSIGTGVAIGDYDGDGRPDLFVVSKVEGCRLFRNLGNWKFEDVTEKAGLRGTAGAWEQGLSWMKKSVGKESGSSGEPWGQGATFVDVNNDGRLDIYFCRFDAPNLLFMNQGDGTFKEEAVARGLAVSDSSGMGAFCDYDRDGWLDVYIQTNMLDAAKNPNGRRGYLFHNNRDGNFTNVTDRAGIGGETLSHSSTWWDYDSDGWPDLYVANDFGPADRLYHNNGADSGGAGVTFTDTIHQVVPHMPYSAMGADLGDVNNDGLVDFFVADMATTTHEKDHRGMASSRELSREDSESTKVAPQFLRNALFVNTGVGYCLEAASLAGIAATDWTWSTRFEDLDNDGRLDLHITNGMNREYQNADLRQRIILATDLAERMRLMRASPKLVETNLAYRNAGDLKFEEVGAAWGLNQKGISFGAAFGDLDGDGDLDLLYVNYESGVSLLRNDSDRGHSIVVALRGTTSNRFGIGATVKIETNSGVQVRPLVLARGYLSSSEPVAHFGLGEETKIKKLTVSWPSGKTQTVTDLNADRKYTLTEPNGPAPALAKPKPTTLHGQFSDVSEALHLSLPTTEGVQPENNSQPLLPTRFNRRGPALAIGDLNGDGKDDVLLAGTSATPPRIMLAGTGAFTPADASAITVNPLVDDGPALIFDANGDGANDLLMTKTGVSVPAGAAEYQPRLYFNDGHGAMRPAPTDALPSLSLSTGAVAAADFTRSGQLGLFLGARILPGQYPTAPRSALLLNHGGKFEDITDRFAPGLSQVGLVTSALWSDADNDGWPDLLLTLEWGQVKYFHNQQGQGLEDWTEKSGFGSAGTGWWNSIATADFNGDGRPDYVVGNVGLNTQYRASPERPAVLYYGAFTDNGVPLLLEGTYEGDKLFPVRTRKELGAKIPTILKRYPKNDPFARATLGEIVGEDKLAAAQRFTATEFQSGVLLSQPDATYRFTPLPRLAQIAPTQGLVAGDFDGDGLPDIYAVQNSYAPIAYVGRFDGGVSQLLRGDGQGNFTPVPAAESALVVTGDAKALSVLDLDSDGWPDFLLTRNNATTQAYRNHGVAGHRSLRISLRGAAGNPTAIGARVTVELADGRTQHSEVIAGSGYASQSSAACFFGYPANNPPKEVRIRWPNGSTTKHPVAKPVPVALEFVLQ